MIDRQVFRTPTRASRDVSPEFVEFNSLDSVRNVVLLGDPGSGKTHLFKIAAQACNGRYMTVRTFLNSPASWGDQALFLDALDERRSGRSDDSVVDQVVQKLFTCPPAKVRISSRTQDWLGESDLEAFNAYFDQNGGVTLVNLAVLSQSAQLAVLQNQGIANGQEFVQEAKDRGLGEFLGNPQNLIMLAAVVKGGDWPTTRLDLFHEATQRWLTEHNQSRSEHSDFSNAELRSAAGALCALRLISDVDGFSLAGDAIDETHPSVSDIPFLNKQLALTALHRRIFSAIPGSDTVDYTHRTTAEYLAAEWIANQLETGLSFRRVMALLGPDGHPATELRGLHAWLAVLAPRFAEELINADPYGFLFYGDAASISPTLRVSLLTALSHLSGIDPWFRYRRDGQHGELLAGMCGPEMTSSYHGILTTFPANHAMRQLVLAALAEGSPDPNLLNVLVSIFASSDAEQVEREGALLALLKLGPAGAAAILKEYPTLGWDANSLQTRVDTVAAGYGQLFGANDVTKLVDSIDELTEKMSGRVYLWAISSAMPVKDIMFVLDSARKTITDPGLDEILTGNESKTSHLLSIMLVKVLGSDEEIAPASLWGWLAKVTDARSSTTSYSMIQKAIQDRRAIVLKALAVGICTIEAETDIYPLFMRLQRMTAGAVPLVELLDLLIERLQACTHESANVRVVYQSALALLLSVASERPAAVEYLCAIGENESLGGIRDKMLLCEISDWRVKQAQRANEQRAKSLEILQRRRADFAASESEIRAGTALRWIGWLAKVYLGIFNDVDTSLPPESRLVPYIGNEFTESALTGLIASMNTCDVPDVRAITQMSRDGGFKAQWFGVVAGLTEAYSGNNNVLGQIPEGVLAAALAIDLLHPTSVRVGNSERKVTFEWKTSLVSGRPALVVDTYKKVIKCDLEAQREHVSGLYELLTSEEFAPYRTSIAMEFLTEYENIREQNLRLLLKIASTDLSVRNEFIALSKLRVASDAQGRGIVSSWLASAFLVESSDFVSVFFDKLAVDVTVAWSLADALMDATSPFAAIHALSPSVLQRLILLTAAHFPNTPHPSGSWWGNRNPWDGAELVRKLLNLLASHSTRGASVALKHLADDSALESYRDNILHAAAEQAVRRRDAEYQQPDWMHTITALKNGAPATASDFYALLLDTLLDVGDRISNSNSNIYKRFWNETGSGALIDPKSEESGRDVLLDLLRERLGLKGIHIEPEGRMVDNKRADIVALFRKLKIPIEIKRNYHADVWTAPEAQLVRQYTRDPDSAGHGIYVVFWFGSVGVRKMPLPPGGRSRPESACEMATLLADSLPDSLRAHIGIVLIDVAGQPGSHVAE